MSFHRMLLVLIVVCLSCSALRADKPKDPYSYKTVTPNGKYVFVMISPLPVNRDAGWSEPKATEVRALRTRYPRSGLYKNDGSTEPLWTVDWYAFKVYPASDGIHLVRPGRRLMRRENPENCPAVDFYASSRLTRSYSVAQLVDRPGAVPHSVTWVLWKAKEEFDDAAMRYTIATEDGNRFVFDAATGKVVSSVRFLGSLRWCLAAIVGVLLLMGCFWWWEHRRRKAETLVPASSGSYHYPG